MIDAWLEEPCDPILFQESLAGGADEYWDRVAEIMESRALFAADPNIYETT